MNQNLCNNCGGEYEYRNGRFVCRACGAYKPEEISNEEVTLLYTAYQNLRLAEFDAAEKEFDDIIEKYPQNPNGYWGRLMARYGIKYERDFDGRMIPTCYAASIESVIAASDYKKALEYADEDTREYYRRQAEYIERVRKEWVEKANREKPYDIFISYKDSDLANGIDRTQDSVEMQELYIHLTNKGYRVFFSRESLRDKVGEKYEPYIFSALSSAKIMLVYGSKPEYITSTWLKNEWTRYEKRITAGEKDPNSLLIACDGFSPAELPRELASRQCFNANTKSFYSDLDEAIEKILHAKKKKIGGMAKSTPMIYPIDKKIEKTIPDKKSITPVVITLCMILAITIGLFSWIGISNSISDTKNNETTTQNTPSGYLPWNNAYVPTQHPNSSIPVGDLILVNAQNAYSLTDSLNSKHLTNLYSYEGHNTYYVLPSNDIKVRSSIIQPLKQMIFDMVDENSETLGTSAEGDRLYISGAYRDTALQTTLNTNNPARYPETPGYSEHHTGLAVDIKIWSDSTSVNLRDTEYEWLEANCAKYGFIIRYDGSKATLTGIADEPYHLRYVGVAHATYMSQRNLCLEEYLELLRTDHKYEQTPLEITADEKEYLVYYVPASAGFTSIPVPPASEGTYSISGDNINGFIVTVEKTAK